MKKTVFIPLAAALLWAIIANTSSYAQSTRAGSDSARVFDLINKADNYAAAYSYDTAIVMVEKALTICRQSNFPKGEAWSLIKYNDILIEKGDYDEAADKPRRIVQLGNLLKDSLVVAIAYLHMAQLKMYNNESDTAIYFFKKALKTKLEKINSSYTALAYNDLGFTYGQLAEYQKETDCCIKSLHLYEQLQDDEGAAMSLGNLATMYFAMDDYKKAIEYQKKSIAKRKENNIVGLAISYCNLCQLYMKAGDLKEAESYAALCLRYSKESKLEARILNGYITAGLLANAKGDNITNYETEKKVVEILEQSHRDDHLLATRYLAAAIAGGNVLEDSLVILGYFKKAMDLAKRLNMAEGIKLNYYYRTVFFKVRRNYYDAYENYKKYIALKDSLNSEETKRTIAELETKYQTAKKDNEINRLSTGQKLKQLEIEKQKAIIAGNLLEAKQKQNEMLVLSQQQQLQDTKLKQQSEVLEKQLLQSENDRQQLKLAQQEKQLKEKELQAQKQLRNMVIAGAAALLLLAGIVFNRYQLKKKLEQQKGLLAMRNSISRDLHDDIGASLSNINILNELARRNLPQPEKSRAYLSKASEDIQHISESLSDIVWNINPKYDGTENLFIRMKRYAADMFDGKNISGQFIFPEETAAMHMTMAQRRDLYLIFKEAVNNLVKYSGAANALVNITTQNKTLSMLVKDDGKGFDAAITANGNGLHNMRQRAAAAGAAFSISSMPGKGTSISLEMQCG